MARLPRIVLSGIPRHVTPQKGGGSAEGAGMSKGVVATVTVISNCRRNFCHRNFRVTVISGGDFRHGLQVRSCAQLPVVVSAQKTEVHGRRRLKVDWIEKYIDATEDRA